MNNLVALSPLLSLTFHGVGSAPYLRLRKPSCTGCLTGRSLHWLRTRVRRDFQNTVAHSHLHIREGRATYTAQRGPAVFTLAPRRKSRFFLARNSSGSRSVADGQHNTQTHIHSRSSCPACNAKSVRVLETRGRGIAVSKKVTCGRAATETGVHTVCEKGALNGSPQAMK